MFDLKKPTDDSWRAKWARLKSPGIGFCLRCGLPWTYVGHHTTWYGRGRGCFPLCTSCWTHLTPAERLPYYETLVSVWADPTIWADVHEAVEAGR